MRECPECGRDRSWAITWSDVEVFQRFSEKKNIPYLEDEDNITFEVARKTIECRSCGWVPPTTDEEEFLRWLNGEEWDAILKEETWEKE